jgi:hypothetical protein
MRIQAVRAIAATLSIIALLAGSPVQAAPVAISEVLQVLSNQQGQGELKLRGVAQDPASGTKGSVQSSVISSETSGSTSSSSSSLLSGIVPGTNDPVVGTVTVIAEGDVDGTVCDCGEIPVAGSIPKWPFLFLAAIPLFFIPECKDCNTPPPPPVCKDCIIIPTCTNCDVPTPTPTPPGEVPEPTSLLLFGSGLAAFGAGLRRRYLRGKLAAQLDAREES